MNPDVQYALSGDTHIAYRVMGEGPLTIMVAPTWASNLDVFFEYPPILEAIERVTSFCRIILFDRRGTGLSDRLGGIATLEEGMDDVLAVLDAVGVEQVALMGINESGPLCSLVAATHPERVSALILYGSFATTVWHPDYPWGTEPEVREQQIEAIISLWGKDGAAFLLNPSGVDDQRFQRWAARWQRNAVTPDALRDVFQKLAKTDVRHVLPTIGVPTLVLHRKDDAIVPVENGRYLAEHIPGAKYFEAEGVDHIPFFGDWAGLVDEVEEFLTGSRRPREPDRVLATIMFTDIVRSTEKAAELGDRRWRDLLDGHDEIVRKHVERFSGKLVKNTGDGHLATFDGPARAIHCACALRSAMAELGLQLRSGLHTGEVEVRGTDLGGIAVHICARVAALAGPNEVLVSGAIPPLVAGSGITFDDRGVKELKGVQGEWKLFAVDL